MKRPIVGFERFAVLRVRFPLTDRQATKNRPALVLSDAKSFHADAGHSVLAMITSAANAPWPLDCRLQDLEIAGLPAPSLVRFKLFALDHRLIRNQIGALSRADQKNVAAALRRLLGPP